MRQTVYHGPQTYVFEGRLIGSGSSFKPDRDRWHEINIFLADDGRYVVQKIGRSTIRGEVDRHSAFFCQDGDGVIQNLHVLDGKTKTWRMLHASRDALNAAMTECPDLEDAFLRPFQPLPVS